jgi:hypothetical protein
MRRTGRRRYGAPCDITLVICGATANQARVPSRRNIQDHLGQVSRRLRSAEDLHSIEERAPERSQGVLTAGKAAAEAHAAGPLAFLKQSVLHKNTKDGVEHGTEIRGQRNLLVVESVGRVGVVFG